MGIYTVVEGDTLSGIAQRVSGDPNTWRRIAARNKLADPNKLKIGQRLDIEGYEDVAVPDPKLRPDMAARPQLGPPRPETPVVSQSARAAGAEEITTPPESFVQRSPRAAGAEYIAPPRKQRGTPILRTAENSLTPAQLNKLRQRQGIGPFPAREEYPGTLPEDPSRARVRDRAIPEDALDHEFGGMSAHIRHNMRPLPKRPEPEPSLHQALAERSVDGKVHSVVNMPMLPDPESLPEDYDPRPFDDQPGDASSLLTRDPEQLPREEGPNFDNANPGPALEITREQVMSLPVNDRKELIRILNMLNAPQS